MWIPVTGIHNNGETTVYTDHLVNVNQCLSVTKEGDDVLAFVSPTGTAIRAVYELEEHRDEVFDQITEIMKSRSTQVVDGFMMISEQLALTRNQQ